MWAEAAKWLGKFDETVLTGLDVDGYPVSIRVDPRNYDATTGTLPAAFPSTLHVIEGPANCSPTAHDEKMWHLNMIQSRVASRVAAADGCSRALISTLRPN